MATPLIESMASLDIISSCCGSTSMGIILVGARCFDYRVCKESGYVREEWDGWEYGGGDGRGEWGRGSGAWRYKYRLYRSVRQ